MRRLTALVPVFHASQPAGYHPAFVRALPTISRAHGLRVPGSCFTTSWCGRFAARRPVPVPSCMMSSSRTVRMGMAAGAQAVSDDNSKLGEGHVVEVVLSSNRRRVAVVERADGKRNWIVADAAGTSTSVAPKQVSYHISSDMKALMVENLDAFERQVEGEVKDAEAEGLLELAWDVVSDGGTADGVEAVTVAQVAEVIFGDAGPRQRYVAHCMLHRDQLYFKNRVIKGVNVYEPRTKQLVEQARAEVAAQLERARRERVLRAALANTITTTATANGDAARELLGDIRYEEVYNALITLALDLNAYGNDAKRQTALTTLTKPQRKDIIMMAEVARTQPSARMCFDVLSAWGVFALHENIYVRAFNLMHHATFDHQSLEMAHDISMQLPPDVDADIRVDLTYLPAFAIDSADTTEVDDALSFDPESNMVWIHIADPCRYLSSDLSNVLIQQALRRVSTLYLPTGKMTMFPESLAIDVLSLSGTSGDCSALSFGFKILDDGDVDEETIRVVNSRISPPTRMTYEEADDILANSDPDSGSELAALYAIALQRRDFRVSEGAIMSSRPHCQVNVENWHLQEPDITVQRIDTEGAAWTLVSELMISACNAAGLFAETNQIPVIYRGQLPFAPPPLDTLAEMPHGVARSALMFKNATPSTTGLKPMSHASLGVDAYVQVTSPIRRACDLVAHLQFKAFLRGDSIPLDEGMLTREMALEADVGRRLRQVENKTNRYWQLLYLARRMNTVWNATVVRLMSMDKTTVIWIDDLAFDVYLPSQYGIKPGSKVQVKFFSIDPLASQCRASIRLLPNTSASTLLEPVSDVEEELQSPL